MGHIQLATPVAHIWFSKGTPSYIAVLLDISPRDLEKVLYFNYYIVIDPKNLPLMKKQLLTEEQYKLYRSRYGNLFDARMGAEAIKILLKELDLEKLEKDLLYQLKNKSLSKGKNIVKRLEVVRSFLNSPSRPEWMILDVIPVIPPDLRPMVPLDGGRFATSDLNDLYRRVITRNNRLKRMMKLGAPDLIIKNEKRMLQEAVNHLIDNGRKGRPVTGTGKRPLKSLTDMLKGKQGRFRQNLLGKRVDYSGRSVIVVGPHLKLDQCGLPQEMALELFKPFLIYKLVDKGKAHNVKKAKKMIERRDPETYDVLEEVVREHPVLLNRAPTLHRFGIQAFNPVLTSGKAIELHPLVCAAFNADFDGDQMAVHVPLLLDAHAESKVLMLSKNNLFSSAHGGTLVSPTHDMVIGSYYLTRATRGNDTEMIKVEKSADLGKYLLGNTPKKSAEEIVSEKTGETIILQEEVFTPEIVKKLVDDNIKEVKIYKQKYFSSISEAIKLYELSPEDFSLHELVWVKIDGKYTETTIGRMIFNSVLPEEFPYYDEQVDKKKISKLIEKVYKKTNHAKTIEFLDKVKALGFHYATLSGLSMSVADLLVPEDKDEIIKNALRKSEEINDRFRKGNLNREEKKQSDIEIWTNTTEEVADAMLQKYQQLDKKGEFNSVYVMAISGARGNMQQIRQLAAMRGLMSNPQGDIIDFPIVSNFYDGLGMTEYFISTYGARKGLVDTALRTADSGYLTRRLVDVSQEIIVREPDCGTNQGVEVNPLRQKRKSNDFNIEEEVIISLKERVIGRFAAEDILHPATEQVLVKKDELIDEAKANLIEKATVVLPMTEQVIGKITAEQVLNEQNNKIVIGPDKEITREIYETILNEGLVEEVKVRPRVVIRSPLTCEAKHGVCQKCYGMDLSTNDIVNIGEAVGIIAAQSIGEPGTQLTMRTFHIGGIALSQRNTIKSKKEGKVSLTSLEWALKAEKSTQVLGESHFEDVKDDEGLEKDTKKVVLGGYLKLYTPDGKFEKYTLPAGAVLKVDEGDYISSGSVIAEYNPNQIISEIKGIVKLKNIVENQGYVISPNGIVEVKSEEGVKKVYKIPQGASLKVHEGDRVVAGDVISEIISEQKAAMANMNGKVEFFDLRVKNGRVINDNGLIFIHPMEREKRIKATYTLPTGVKERKGEIDISSYGVQVKVKSGDEVKYMDELIAIYSEIDGQVSIQKNKKKILIENQENKEYRLEKEDYLVVDRGENKFYYVVPEDGYLKLIGSNLTAKTASHKRLILSDEKAYNIPRSIKLKLSDCKIKEGGIVKKGEQITSDIRILSDFDGVVELHKDEYNNEIVKLKSIQSVNLMLKDKIKPKLLGKSVFKDIINKITGEIILEAGNIINEQILKDLIVEAPISGTVNFSNIKEIDSYKTVNEIAGLKLAEDIEIDKKKLARANDVITEELAQKIIDNKDKIGTFKIIKNEITIKAQKIFDPNVENDISEFTGWTFVKDVVNYDKDKVVIKAGEKVTASNVKNLAKKLNGINLSEIVLSRKVTVPVPDGVTLRIQSGEQVKEGEELTWPTQINEILIISEEKDYLIPPGAVIKVKDGDIVKKGANLIEPLKPIVSEITGRVNYHQIYIAPGEEIITKIYIYSGKELRIPVKVNLNKELQKLLKNSPKPIPIKAGTVISEELDFSEIKEDDDFYYIYRSEVVNKSYNVSTSMDILVEDGDVVKRGTKLANLINKNYLCKEVISWENSEGNYYYKVANAPINPNYLRIKKNTVSVYLQMKVNLEQEVANISKKLSKMKALQEIKDIQTGEVLVEKKGIISAKVAKYIEQNAENIEPRQIEVTNPNISVIYSTGEIYLKSDPGKATWLIEYATDLPGVVKMLKKENLKSVSRTSLGKIEVFSGESYPVQDGAELRVHHGVASLIERGTLKNRVINHVIEETIYDKATGEVIVEAGQIVNGHTARTLYRRRNSLNKQKVSTASYVRKGEILAKWGASSKKTVDIIQGLPRVEEVFEVRKPKKESFFVEINGRAHVKGNTLIVTNSTGEVKTYKTSFSSGKILVDDGEFVTVGDQITEGYIVPQTLLNNAGINKVQQYLLNEVQQVYRTQGVKINDKHIEVILRQMMRKVVVQDPGDTVFLPGERVQLTEFYEENERVKKEGKEPAKGKRVLQGVTKASLSTESFISAASFQETTRVLTKAAIEGKKDRLLGLKENLILGKLIPAGTGLDVYDKVTVRPAKMIGEELSEQDITDTEENAEISETKTKEDEIFRDIESLLSDNSQEN
jgi:DNA-directed RNA polymerase subunit beta'